VHLVPALLAEGIRLFDHLGAARVELETTRVVEPPRITHICYRIF
jgi:hypothetical protein